MNHIRTILKAIRRVQSRMLLNRIIRCAVYAGIMGTLPGLVVLALSVWIPFYYAVPVAVAAGLLGLLAGICYGVITRPLQSQAAFAADRAGLDEYLITALEFKGSDRIFHRLQREQATESLSRFDIRAAFPIVFPVKECLVFALSVCLCVAFALVPAAAKNAAQEQHDIQQKVAEETAKIEKVLDDIEKDDTASGLSDELLDELAGLLNEALAEMESAESIEELEKAKERLDKKTEIAADQMENQDFTAMTQRISGELGFSGRMDKQKTLAELEDRIRESMKDANSSLTEEELEELAKRLSEQLQNGSDPQTSVAEAAEMLGMDEEALRQELERIEAEVAQGDSQNGDGNGFGAAIGDGSGNEAFLRGDLPGGQGYDTGGKTGFEKDSSGIRPAEELEIPGRVLGDDDNLTGMETYGQSYFIETENGLAWSGRKVDYGEVVGEYAAEAQNRINRSEVPNDMKEIVRDYFSGLTN